jgi:hypothetical protein
MRADLQLSAAAVGAHLGNGVQGLIEVTHEGQSLAHLQQQDSQEEGAQ